MAYAVREYLRRDYEQSIRHGNAHGRVAVVLKALQQTGKYWKIIGREIRGRISSFSGKYNSNFVDNRTAQHSRLGAIGRDVERYWQACRTEIMHSNPCPHRRALGKTVHQTLQCGRNLRGCRSKNSKPFHRQNRLIFPVVNRPVKLPWKESPDLRLSRLVLPCRPVVMRPFDQPGQSIRSDVPDRILGLRPAIVISPGVGDFQPRRQGLGVIFGFVVPGPKRDHTGCHHKRNGQNDENPSSAHNRSISNDGEDGKNRTYGTDGEGIQCCTQR